MGGETKELAKLIANTKYSDFPEETITLAKLCMMDLVGVTLLGAKEPVTEVLLKVAKEIGSRPQATVIGRGEKVSVLDAAMINGTAGHSMDYDDTHLGPVGDKTLGMNGHPSVPVLPAVFAAAEWNRLSGQDLLTAFLVGFEVECRIGFRP